LAEVIPGDAGVILDWPVAAAYPCNRPVSLALGAVEMPTWRIGGDPSLLGLAGISFAPDHAGPFVPVLAVAEQVLVPTYLVNKWDREVATVYRISPRPLASPDVSVSHSVELGWSRQPRLVVPGVDDVKTVE
ncbi:MAG TPA: arabinosyltransferase C-terminal domain-containing protein, partial [Acidimicrobiales bacterium]|nr:arabinosyltransferase C-terminal domain-containing protein [Acidimicrobiales bacterium]